MSKVLKTISAALISLVMIASGTQGASAAPGPLTLAQFRASAGYQLLQASNDATSAYLATKDFVKVTADVSTSLGGTVVAGSLVEIVASKTASKVTMSLTSGGVSSGELAVYGYSNGQFYSAIPADKDASLTAALARLKKPAAKYMTMPSSSMPETIGDISPTGIFAGSKVDPLASLDGVLNDCTFQPVVSAANSQDPSLTDYFFEAIIPGSGIMPEVAMTITQTVNADNIIVKQKANSVVGGIIIEMTTTIETPATLTLPSLSAGATVKEADVTTMTSRIAAERALATKVKTLSAKATALAKSARKTLTAAHLSAAAKALKYVVTAIKNGVKLSAKVSGVTGSVCVTVVKGKPVSATC